MAVGRKYGTVDFSKGCLWSILCLWYWHIDLWPGLQSMDGDVPRQKDMNHRRFRKHQRYLVYGPFSWEIWSEILSSPYHLSSWLDSLLRESGTLGSPFSQKSWAVIQLLSSHEMICAGTFSGRWHGPCQHCWQSPCFPTFQPQQLFVGVFTWFQPATLRQYMSGQKAGEWEGVSRSRPSSRFLLDRVKLQFVWFGLSSAGLESIGILPHPAVAGKSTKLWVNPSNQKKHQQHFQSGQEVLRWDPAFWNLLRHSWFRSRCIKALVRSAVRPRQAMTGIQRCDTFT